MRYSIEPRERRYAKRYGFLSFARNIGTHAAKVAKSMSNKYTPFFYINITENSLQSGICLVF